jgi:hypothetical protein
MPLSDSNILLNQRSVLLSLVFELTVVHMYTVVTVISRLVEEEYESDQLSQDMTN